MKRIPLRAFRLPLGLFLQCPVSVLRIGPLYLIWRHKGEEGAGT